MSTPDSAAVWSATSLAFDEKAIAAAGLSVRQRKLLTLLSTPASLPQLAQSIAQPIADVQSALERFAKLGLAHSSEAMPLSPMQTQLRSASPNAVEAPSRMPVMVGVAVAVLAAVGAGTWLLRGGSPSAVSAPVATAPKTQAPTATGPSDTAGSGLPGPATKPAAAAAPVPVTAAATAAATLAAAAPSRPTLTPATPPGAAVAAAVLPPTKAAATPTAAPSAAPATPAATSTTLTPTTVAPTAPALTLATTLPAVPAAPVAAAGSGGPAGSGAQPATAPAVAASTTSAPATQVATAPVTSSTTATARPAPAAAREIKLVNRVEPSFPRGYDADKGTVRARLQVDAKGAVTAVDIVEANPPRVFDRTVRTALQQWRYEPTGEAFSVIAEINFTR